MEYATGRIIWNSLQRRRNAEFRSHLSNVIAHMEREGLKKAIQFVDKASYHDTPEVGRFLKRHPEIGVKHLPKKCPNVKPAELLFNRRIHSALIKCYSRYYGRKENREAGSIFPSLYNSQYAFAQCYRASSLLNPPSHIRTALPPQATQVLLW